MSPVNRINYMPRYFSHFNPCPRLSVRVCPFRSLCVPQNHKQNTNKASREHFRAALALARDSEELRFLEQRVGACGRAMHSKWHIRTILEPASRFSQNSVGITSGWGWRLVFPRWPALGLCEHSCNQQVAFYRPRIIMKSGGDL